MNSTHILPSIAAPRSRRALANPPVTVQESLQSRFALQVCSRLAEASEDLAPDISERLRHAREQALLRARSVRAASAASSARTPVQAGGVLGSRVSGWRLKFAALVPGLALVGGLVLIQTWQDSTQVSVAAEIDAALLSDDLPPNAYSDAGFAEYLKTPAE